MSKIAILTDSSCDIPQELAEKYGIDIMGFHILLDDEDIVEREKYTPEEFYDKMRAAKGIPSTAAITPIQFCEKYCQYVDEGYTDVIHVPINRSGSSTYNNAVMAQGMLREERPEHHLNIHLLDPHTYSMVFGWYLCEMARKLQNGAELRHVISEFETQMNKMEVILGPYSLKQMKKSRRGHGRADGHPPHHHPHRRQDQGGEQGARRRQGHPRHDRPVQKAHRGRGGLRLYDRPHLHPPGR